MKQLIVIGLSVLALSSTALAVDYVPKDIWGGQVNKVAADPLHPGTMYATSFDVFKSTDGGATWVKKEFDPAPANVPADTVSAGGYIHRTNGVAVNSHGVVIAADTNWSPVWRSADGGDSWQWIGSFNTLAYADFKQARLVAASAYDPNNFFAVIEPQKFGPAGPIDQASALWASGDEGLTWNATQLTVTENQTIVDVLQIPDGPHAGRVIALVVDAKTALNEGSTPLPSTGRIYYSDDAFATLAGTQQSAQTAIIPGKVTWDSLNHLAWLITKKGEIYSSSDGDTWNLVFSMPGIVNTNCRSTAIVYAAGNSGAALFAAINTSNAGQVDAVIYKSIDASTAFSTWSKIPLENENAEGKTIVSGNVFDLAVDLRFPELTHWGIANGYRAFYYTTDDGVNLHEATGINTSIINYGLKDSATNRVFALESKAVHFSADNGQTWNLVYPAPGRCSILYCDYLAFDPAANSQKLYLVGEMKIFSSADNGADHFTMKMADFTVSPYTYTNSNKLSNLLINYSHPDIMYVGVSFHMSGSPGTYLYKSIDGGATWQNISTLISNGISYLAMDPVDPDVIYAACSDGTLAQSSFTADGLFKSSDGGSTWTYCGFKDCRITMISLDAAAPQMLLVNYMRLGGGYYTSMSNDKGSTWQSLQVQTDFDVREAQSLTCFMIGTSIMGGNWSGEIWQNNDFGSTPMQKIATLPTAVAWLFKGSVYAASNSGLYTLTLPSGAIRTYTGGEFKMYNYPNPFNPKTTATAIRVSLPNATTALRIKIYSLAGDLVSDNTINHLQGKYSYVFYWDGKNDQNTLCAPGLYYAVADADGAKARHKIVLAY